MSVNVCLLRRLTILNAELFMDRSKICFFWGGGGQARQLLLVPLKSMLFSSFLFSFLSMFVEASLSRAG